MSELACVANYPAVRARLMGVATRPLPPPPVPQPVAVELVQPPREISPEEARVTAVLAEMLPARIRKIQREVCAQHGVTLDEMLSPSRKATVTEARQWAMWRVYHEIAARMSPRMSLPDIGHRFGRDHTTVLHAVRKMDALAASSPRHVEEGA
jgi:chromosomal replication initiator protein